MTVETLNKQEERKENGKVTAYRVIYSTSWMEPASAGTFVSARSAAQAAVKLLAEQAIPSVTIEKVKVTLNERKKLPKWDIDLLKIPLEKILSKAKSRRVRITFKTLQLASETSLKDWRYSLPNFAWYRFLPATVTVNGVTWRLKTIEFVKNKKNRTAAIYVVDCPQR